MKRKWEKNVTPKNDFDVIWCLETYEMNGRVLRGEIWRTDGRDGGEGKELEGKLTHFSGLFPNRINWTVINPTHHCHSRQNDTHTKKKTTLFSIGSWVINWQHQQQQQPVLILIPHLKNITRSLSIGWLAGGCTTTLLLPFSRTFLLTIPKPPPPTLFFYFNRSK